MPDGELLPFSARGARHQLDNAGVPRHLRRKRRNERFGRQVLSIPPKRLWISSRESEFCGEQDWAQSVTAAWEQRHNFNGDGLV